jgi:hypothetical protein
VNSIKDEVESRPLARGWGATLNLLLHSGRRVCTKRALRWSTQLSSRRGRWTDGAGTFDNWALRDALSFNLFDRMPHARAEVAEWCSRRKEFEKRTAFAPLWSLTVHDKRAIDEQFVEGLALIEREATVRRLAESPDATSQWVGRTRCESLRVPDF